MSSISASVEAKALLEKLKRADAAALIGVRAVVMRAALEAQAEYQRLVSVPAQGIKGNRHAGVRGVKAGASRPGQPPRKRTGRLQKSTHVRTKFRGLAAYMTVDATDAKGRRYAWMLEAGTKHVKKRPAIKKVQRKVAKTFRPALVAAIRRAVR